MLMISLADFIVNKTKLEDATDIYNQWTSVCNINIEDFDIATQLLSFITSVQKMEKNIIKEAIKLDERMIRKGFLE